MTRNSLAFRLFATSLVWSLIVLPLTGLLLYKFYRDEVEEDFETRLELASDSLVSVSTDSGTNAPILPKRFGEGLFNLPLSGWYWQVSPIDGKPGRQLTSESLVGETLEFPYASSLRYKRPGYQFADIAGPGGASIRMLERQYTLGTGADERRYAYVVTGNLGEIDVSVANFGIRLAIGLSVLGMGLVAATLFQVRFGLQPLAAIENGLARIRSGEKTRLEGDLPAEIVPLQRELNQLIKSNQDIIERSRTHVGNLAHALKTPLSVITNEARTEDTPFARKVAEQAAIMRDQVNHHLDRARMVARTGVMAGVTDVRPVVEALGRTLQRIYGERRISVETRCPADLKFQGEKQDLEEMLGNLLDNACKWASRAVALSVTLVPDRGGSGPRQQIAFVVEDDGPGLTEEQRREALKRGKRLDESKPGSGLGLSIVTDLASLYGGTLELGQSKRGGLQAKLLLPKG